MSASGSVSDQFRMSAAATDIGMPSLREIALRDSRLSAAPLIPLAARETFRSKPLERPENLRVEWRSLRDMGVVRLAWQNLVERAIEPNVFCDPSFCESAALHIAADRQLAFLLVWATDGSGRNEEDVDHRWPDNALLGLFPVLWPRLSLMPGQVRGWRSAFAPLGTPLVDARRARATLGALLDWLGKRGPHFGGLHLCKLDEDGPFATILRDVAVTRGLSIRRFEGHHRAVLNHRSWAEAEDAINPRKLKELRRQQRRLAELGMISVEHRTEPRAVRDGIELFLALEASGWKGREQTALLSDTRTSSFVRALSRGLARNGRMRVVLMWLDNKVIAAALLMESGDRSWLWKISYDETYARFSPGVQLVLDITRHQLTRNGIVVTDSCAIPDHPMIDALWRDRMPVGDWMIATAKPGTFTLMGSMHEAARRRLRGMAKSAYRKLRPAS